MYIKYLNLQHLSIYYILVCFKEPIASLLLMAQLVSRVSRGSGLKLAL